MRLLRRTPASAPPTVITLGDCSHSVPTPTCKVCKRPMRAVHVAHRKGYHIESVTFHCDTCNRDYDWTSGFQLVVIIAIFGVLNVYLWPSAVLFVYEHGLWPGALAVLLPAAFVLPLVLFLRDFVFRGRFER